MIFRIRCSIIIKDINDIAINMKDQTYFNGVYNIEKDNNERLRFNYQLHFLTYDKDLRINDNLSKHIFRHQRLDESKAQVNQYPQWYLFKGEIKNAYKISEMDSKEGRPWGGFASTVGNYFRLNGFKDDITIVDDYDGYALVAYNGDILMTYEKDISAGTYSSIKQIIPETWTFRLTKKKNWIELILIGWTSTWTFFPQLKINTYYQGGKIHGTKILFRQ